MTGDQRTTRNQKKKPPANGAEGFVAIIRVFGLRSPVTGR